jgi:hypothetical protein
MSPNQRHRGPNPERYSLWPKDFRAARKRLKARNRCGGAWVQSETRLLTLPRSVKMSCNLGRLAQTLGCFALD